MDYMHEYQIWKYVSLSLRIKSHSPQVYVVHTLLSLGVEPNKIHTVHLNWFSSTK